MQIPLSHGWPESAFFQCRMELEIGLISFNWNKIRFSVPGPSTLIHHLYQVPKSSLYCDTSPFTFPDCHFGYINRVTVGSHSNNISACDFIILGNGLKSSNDFLPNLLSYPIKIGIQETRTDLLFTKEESFTKYP